MKNYSSFSRIRPLRTTLALLFCLAAIFMLTGCSSNQKYKVSGRIKVGGSPKANVPVKLEGGPTKTNPTQTDADGYFSFADLSEGTYTLMPDPSEFPELVFSPLSRKVYLYGFDAVDFDFSGIVVNRLAASDHTIYMKTADNVLAWGKNGSGQLGDLTTTDRNTPVAPVNLPKIKAVAVGGGQIVIGEQTVVVGHTVALADDGTVWTWGDNIYGQLGNGTNTNNPTPAQVAELTKVVAVAAGKTHTVVLKEDGTVWAWGKNDKGQLGDGTTTDSNKPVQVKGLSSSNGFVAAIAAGDAHTVVLGSDGTVWSVGSNSNGQLGNTTAVESKVFVPTSGILTAIAVSAGDKFTVVLKRDGTVWAWGINDKGQLGNNSTTEKALPVQVKDLTSVAMISAGNQHAVALKQDGTVWSWGSNSKGQLGDGMTANSLVPVKAKDLSGVVSIEAGNDYTISLKTEQTDYSFWAWGSNLYGQLGDGKNEDSHVPKQIF